MTKEKLSEKIYYALEIPTLYGHEYHLLETELDGGSIIMIYEKVNSFHHIDSNAKANMVLHDVKKQDKTARFVPFFGVLDCNAGEDLD